MKIALAAAICLFWASMTGWLLHREVFPSLHRPPSITYRSLLARMGFPHLDRFSVVVAGNSVGTIQTEYRRAAWGKGFEIDNLLRARPGLGTPDIGEIQGSWTLHLDESYRPVQIDLVAQVPALGLERFEAQGWFKQELCISYRINGGPAHALTLACPPGTLFGTGVGWLGTIDDLHVGKTWHMTTVDLLSSLMSRQIQTADLTCEVTGLDAQMIDGKEIPVFTAVARTASGAASLWFSKTGELIRARIAGVELVRTY